LPGDAEPIGWWIGTGTAIGPAVHLTVAARGTLNVNCELLRDEMLVSMKTFASYLDTNTDRLDDRVPGDCMQRSF
jgi:hypothetical protein